MKLESEDTFANNPKYTIKRKYTFLLTDLSTLSNHISQGKLPRKGNSNLIKESFSTNVKDMERYYNIIA